MNRSPRHCLPAAPAPRFFLITLFTLVAIGYVSLPASALADDSEGRDKQTNSQGEDSQSEEKADPQSMADQHSPALGVMVGACPGDGVCVLGSLWGSPAHNVGIREGDYILALNDQTVNSPEELRELVRQQAAGEEVQLKLWRQGEVLDRSVTLATKATEPPNSHRAWLGVMLRSPEQGEGIVIEHVHPGSPAEDAGIQSGDRLVQLAEEEITSIEDFISDVRDYGPGSELKLTISRNGGEQLLSVVLGEVEEAPLRWMRHAFRTPIDQLEQELQSRQGPGVGVMDEVVEDLRRQLRELQRQMDEFSGQRGDARGDQQSNVEKLKEERVIAKDATAKDSDNSDRKKRRQNRKERRRSRSDRQDAAAEEATTFDRANASSDDITLVVQRPNDRRDQRDSRGRRDRQRFGKYGNPDFYDRLNNQRNRFDYGNNRYRSYYGNPRYRTPYTNRYYRYGGRPYYYGGRALYGPRFGVRVGPNLGLYWY